jgi:signal peptidase I
MSEGRAPYCIGDEASSFRGDASSPGGSAAFRLSVVLALIVGFSMVVLPGVGRATTRLRIVHVRHPYTAGLVDSDSMEPTIHCANPVYKDCEASGQSDVLVEDETGARFIKRGSVIWFGPIANQATAEHCPFNGHDAVKRVIGLPGDRIVEASGHIIRNGRRLSEPYVPSKLRDHRSGVWLVPKNSYFVLGDNRKVSCDSRIWGAVPRSKVHGQVVQILRTSGPGTNPAGPPIRHLRFRLEPGDLPTPAMEPAIHCARPRPMCRGSAEDLVLTQLTGARSVRRYDIIDFRLPAAAARYCSPGIALERVIGLPGEHVTEKHGAIFVNGRQLRQPYIPGNERDTHSGSWKVPERSFFVMADFRAESCDSRYWGPVPRANILGRVVEIIRSDAAH